MSEDPFLPSTPRSRFRRDSDEATDATDDFDSQQDLSLEMATLSPFFQRLLPQPTSTSTTPRPQRSQAIRDRQMRAPRSAPALSSIQRERNQYLRHVFRDESPELLRQHRNSGWVLLPQVVRRRHPEFEFIYPLDPPSPTESQECTPTSSRQNSPSPPRSPVQLAKETDPVPPPNSPIGEIPSHWAQRAEDNINMGLGWAHSWIDSVKPLGNQAEERMSLPKIYNRVPRRTLICLIAHMNVDETVFHKIEIPMKTEKKVRQAIAKFFQLPIPFHRLRLKVDKFAEVPVNQKIINRFDSVEYFRLDTKIPNRWILHQIVNWPQERKDVPMCKPNFEVAKKGSFFF
ncbi:hypothetical protein CAEBREN_24588 [Caenorhabditis brenneri]|uniref:Uncharacterized protein n=1 Tax=Caenorhabditis brenneri TaxID=135651 RepID=G0NQG4_CAEBE|nr:hypothetical protein CAEBREN_24588 [Caenorhabditis brenneri]